MDVQINPSPTLAHPSDDRAKFLNQQFALLEPRIEALKSECARQERTISTYRSGEINLREEIRTLKAQLDARFADLTLSENELVAWRGRAEVAEYESTERGDRLAIQAYDNENLRKVRAELNTELTTLRGRLAEAREELSTALAELTETQSTQAHDAEAHSAQVSVYVSQIGDLNRVVRDARAHAERMEAAAERLRERVELQSDQWTEASLQIQRLQAEGEQLRQGLRHRDQEVEELTEAAFATKLKYSEKCEELERARLSFAIQRDELAQDHAVALTSQVANHRHEIAGLERKFAAANQTLNEERAAFTRERADLNERHERELANLRASLRSANESHAIELELAQERAEARYKQALVHRDHELQVVRANFNAQLSEREASHAEAKAQFLNQVNDMIRARDGDHAIYEAKLAAQAEALQQSERLRFNEAEAFKNLLAEVHTQMAKRVP